MKFHEIGNCISNTYEEGCMMKNHFAMDQNLMKQLNIIRSLESHSETTVRSLYSQAIIEYSLYHHEKNKLLELIDKALASKNETDFYKYATKYQELIEKHREGKKIVENGFELYLTFD